MNQATLLPPTIHRAAEISACGQYRWTLHRTWNLSGNRLCWIMNNPSDGDHSKDDPTILRCTHFTRVWGFGGFVVANLYPFRSSSPEACRAWVANSPDVATAMETNRAVIDRALRDSAMVVAAWGNQDRDRPAESVARMALQAHPIIKCLGTTNSGAPKHPMARGKHRVPNDQQPVIWRTC